MGLAGRKTKQRIPNDPRNLAWANDASKFGAAYLTKLGWDPSRGLGVSGEGRTTALSVNQKLDMLGIGADHKNSVEGMAWKQNKDFERLLARLNAANGNGEVQGEEPMKIDGFVRPTAKAESENEVAPSVEADGEAGAQDGEKKSKKKRKKGEQEDEGEERKKKRKKSKSSEDTSDAEESSKKDKKKKKKRDEAEEVDTHAATASPSPAPFVPSTLPSRHPRAAYRGRHMAAKSLASKSASAIAEILGLAPTPTSSPSPTVSGYPSSAPTPYPSTPFEPGPSTSTSGSDTPADAEQLKLQELTVSSKSVMDYFREKLAAKSNARVYGSAPSSGTDTPAEDDYDERPRIGLGASKLRVEVTQATETVEERRGLGGIGSGMRSSFAAMFTSATVTKTVAEETVVEASPADEAVADADTDEDQPKKSKDRKDKERKKEKKSKKEKGKEKATTVEDEAIADADAASDAATDEKAERKRWKEKRRRKEAAAQANAGAMVADDTAAASDAEEKVPKRKKDKKKSKADR